MQSFTINNEVFFNIMSVLSEIIDEGTLKFDPNNEIIRLDNISDNFFEFTSLIFKFGFLNETKINKNFEVMLNIKDIVKILQKVKYQKGTKTTKKSKGKPFRFDTIEMRFSDDLGQIYLLPRSAEISEDLEFRIQTLSNQLQARRFETKEINSCKVLSAPFKTIFKKFKTDRYGTITVTMKSDSFMLLSKDKKSSQELLGLTHKIRKSTYDVIEKYEMTEEFEGEFNFPSMSKVLEKMKADFFELSLVDLKFNWKQSNNSVIEKAIKLTYPFEEGSFIEFIFMKIPPQEEEKDDYDEEF